MSRTTLFAGAALAALSLAPAAHADLELLDDLTLARLAASPGERGDAHGTLRMPTLLEHGELSGDLHDDLGAARYRVRALLSTFVPLHPEAGQRVALGGVYGELLELSGGRPQPVAFVDGMWRMEKNLTGELELVVWRRAGAGGVRIAGVLTARFAVAEDGSGGLSIDGERTRAREVGDPVHPPSLAGGGGILASATGVSARPVREQQAPEDAVASSSGGSSVTISGKTATGARAVRELPHPGARRAIGTSSAGLAITGQSSTAARAVQGARGLPSGRRASSSSGSAAIEPAGGRLERAEESGFERTKTAAEDDPARSGRFVARYKILQ